MGNAVIAPDSKPNTRVAECTPRLLAGEVGAKRRVRVQRCSTNTLTRLASLGDLSRRAGEVYGGRVSFIGSCVPTVAALIIGACALAYPAASQPAPGWKQTTAKQLAAECHATDAAHHANCVGYVTGVYDLQFAPTPPHGVCVPPDLSPDLLTEVVTAYLDTHDDGPAPAAIGQAIVRFFPCTEQRK
jgi:hypothetical protein